MEKVLVALCSIALTTLVGWLVWTYRERDKDGRTSVKEAHQKAHQGDVINAAQTEKMESMQREIANLIQMRKEDIASEARASHELTRALARLGQLERRVDVDEALQQGRYETIISLLHISSGVIPQSLEQTLHIEATGGGDEDTDTDASGG